MNRLSILVLAVGLVLTGCDSGSEGEKSPLGGRVITVLVGGAGTDVVLADVGTEMVDGVVVVRLGDVVRLAGIEPEEGGFLVDLVGGDGFRPGSRSPCAGMTPFEVGLLDSAFIVEATGESGWAAELGYPGCMSVGGLATIELTADVVD